MIEGKKIIFDEFNNMDSNVRFSLKPFYTLKPGDTFRLQEDGETEYTVAQGFGFLATGNLPSEKHPERKPLDPAETREFAMPHLDHMPAHEVYDLLLISSLRKDLTSPLTPEEAANTMKNLADAIKGVHSAYEGNNPDITRDVIKREKAILQKAVLDPKEYISWIKGYKNQTAESLPQYLAGRISDFMSKGDFPENDKKIMFQIFATKGLIDGVDAASFGFDPRDAQKTYNWNPDINDIVPESRRTNIETLAELDPYNMRPVASISAEDWLNENRGVMPSVETKTSQESKENIILAELKKILIAEGVSSSLAYACTGLSTPEAMVMRQDLIDAGASKGSIAQGLAGVSTPEAMVMRQEFIDEGVDKDYIARGLAGVSTPEAMVMRQEFIDEGASRNYIASSYFCDGSSVIYMTEIYR